MDLFRRSMGQPCYENTGNIRENHGTSLKTYKGLFIDSKKGLGIFHIILVT